MRQLAVLIVHVALLLALLVGVAPLYEHLATEEGQLPRAMGIWIAKTLMLIQIALDDDARPAYATLRQGLARAVVAAGVDSVLTALGVLTLNAAGGWVGAGNMGVAFLLLLGLAVAVAVPTRLAARWVVRWE